MTQILLADDDEELTQMLSEYLEAEGFRVRLAHDGEAALARVAEGGVALMVLDVMMPRMNGMGVLRSLRSEPQWDRLPVLMLTARGDDVDSIIGLELGADDYLAKPCNPRVLVARIRAILRRAEHQQGGNTEHAETSVEGDLEIRHGARKVLLNGQPVSMTSTEFSVLESLVKAAGRVVAKAELSEQALGRPLGRYDRSLDMHVSNLRKKLGPLRNGNERIQTVRGVGYQYTRETTS